MNIDSFTFLHYMRLLADENFPESLVEDLRTQGHDVLWAATDFQEWSDKALLDLAEHDSRLLLTLDKDFVQIAIQRRFPLRQTGVVLFRVHPATPETLDPLVKLFVAAETQWAGHISTITLRGIDVVPLRSH